MDGVFDLFHVGHLDAIKQCAKLGTDVVIGVVNDKDTESYKRVPIINETMRCEMIEACKYVNEVVFPAPLVVTPEFVKENNIDIVVHAFSDEDDYQKQKLFFGNINLHRIEYSTRTNTTQIINNIKQKMKYNIKKIDALIFLQSKYLYKGYREGGTYLEGIMSLFRIHNETMNAWTILIAIPINTFMLIYFLCTFVTGFNIIPFFLCWLSTIIHVPCSIGNHLFLPISPEVSARWRKYDLIAIFVVCPLLTFSFSYFVFSLKTTMLISSICSYISIININYIYKSKDMECEIKDRISQTIQIGYVVSFYLFPILFKSFYYFIRIFISLALGALLFAYNFPEKYFPNTFCIYGQGQQFMHLTLVIANILEMLFLKYAYFTTI